MTRLPDAEERERAPAERPRVDAERERVEILERRLEEAQEPHLATCGPLQGVRGPGLHGTGGLPNASALPSGDDARTYQRRPTALATWSTRQPWGTNGRAAKVRGSNTGSDSGELLPGEDVLDVLAAVGQVFAPDRTHSWLRAFGQRLADASERFHS